MRARGVHARAGEAPGAGRGARIVLTVQSLTRRGDGDRRPAACFAPRPVCGAPGGPVYRRWPGRQRGHTCAGRATGRLTGHTRGRKA